VSEHAVENAQHIDATAEGVDEFAHNAAFLDGVSEHLASGAAPHSAIDSARSQYENIFEKPEDTSAEDDAATTPVVPLQQMMPQNSTEASEPVAPVVPPVETTPVSTPEADPPEHTPLTPLPRATATGGGAGGRTAGGPPRALDTAPEAPRSELTSESPDVSRMNEHYYRDRGNGNLLLGGALGYLFGRRRGRIKTEERLQPQIDTQKSEIDRLTESLTQSEEAIKKQAREHVEDTTPKAEQAPVVLEAPQEAQPEASVEQPVAEAREASPHATPEAPPAEAPAAESQPEEPENDPVLARDVLESQLHEYQGLQQRVEQAETSAQAQPEVRRDARTMGVSELLEVSEGIMLGSVSLKEMYLAGRMNESDMRTVVTEYLRGDNYERTLKQSLEVSVARAETSKEVDTQQSAFAAQSRAKMQRISNSTSVARSSSDAPQDMLQSAGADLDLKDDAPEPSRSPTITNNAAIVLGVVAGIILMILLFLVTREQ